MCGSARVGLAKAGHLELWPFSHSTQKRFIFVLTATPHAEQPAGACLEVQWWNDMMAG